MPKRRPSSPKSRTPLLLGVLALLALLVFVGGELLAFANSDNGRVWTARYLHLGDRAHLVRVVGKRIHDGLAAANVPPAAVAEDVLPGAHGPALRWRVSLPREGAPMQVNYAVTRAVEKGGAVVISGRERPGEFGAQTVTMEIGLPGRPTHELIVTRGGRPVLAADDPPPAARVALVLYGLGDDDATRAAFARREPLAVALPATGDGHASLLKKASGDHREIVMQIPMEPENYPRANPGPGTLLVSMPARRIEELTREYLGSAHGVVAVSNLMGSFATQDEPFMTALYRELKRSHMTFLHVQPPPRSVCRSLAASLGVAYAEPDEILDGEARAAKPAALDRAWKVVLERARVRGHAIVWLRVTPQSVKWLDSALSPRHFENASLVPLSDLLHRPAAM